MRERREDEWNVVRDYETDTIRMYFTKKHLWKKTIDRLESIGCTDYTAEDKHGGFFLSFSCEYSREPWQFVKANTRKADNLKSS